MRLRATVAGDQLSNSPDAELASRAAKGDSPAFEELYRRHAPAAWRLAYAVACNTDDAADAVSEAFTNVLTGLSAGRLDDVASFRSYLLTATRHCAIDLRRRVDRLEPTDRTERLDRPSVSTGPVEKVTAGVEAALVASAFRSLPERWRSVLWLTEVEGVPAREAGARLGLSANTAAQLALRARAGLRERYLQAHLAEGVRPECKATVEKLGAYVAGRLAPRDLAKVDQHLAGCESCRARKQELEDVRSSLRRIVLPLPLLLAPATARHFETAMTASSASPTSTMASASAGASLVAKAQKPLMAVSTGLFALGVISAGVVARPRGGVEGATRPPAAVALTTAPPVIADRVNATFASTSATDFEGLDGVDEIDSLPTGGDVPASSSDGLPTQESDGGATTRNDSTPPPEVPAPKPIAQAAVVVALGPVDAGISLGQGPGACTGGMVGSSKQGCAPAPSDAPVAGVGVETKGSAIGPLDGQKVNIGI